MIRIAYQGEPGNANEEAVRAYFGNDASLAPRRSVSEVLQSVVAGETDGCLVRVENVTTGVDSTVTSLLQMPELVVVAEISLPVSHCLLCLPGQTLRDMRQVLSHPLALAECQRYLRGLRVELVSTFDTAGSARYLYEQERAGVAAVASARVASRYHLSVLAEGIQDHPLNTTRYALLRRQPVHSQRAGTGAPGAANQLLRGRLPQEVEAGGIATRAASSAPARVGTRSTLEAEGRGYGGANALGRTLVRAAASENALVRAPLSQEERYPASRRAPQLLQVQRAPAYQAPGPLTWEAAPLPLARPAQRAAVPALAIKKLCKVYGKGKQAKLAVDRLSLEIEQGAIFGLLGPNGSGKTTTINMLSGLLRPSSGSIHLLGFDVSRARDLRQIRQRLGAVPQETALYEDLSAQENLAFHGGLYGVPRRQRPQRIRNMLELAGLFERRHERVKTFSGGMKRRLAIARALLHDPQLLYLDEPTLGVDVQSRRAIWDYILALREQGKTVLITTNYLEEAQALCDRLAIIDHGRLIALDTPARLKARYGASVIELDLASPFAALERLERLEGVLRVTPTRQSTHLTITTQRMNEVLPQLLAQFSEPPTSIAVHEPNLDDVFLQLTGAALRD